MEAGRPGKKRAKMNVCKICRLADPESGEGDIDWVQCKFCDEWGHLECSDINAEEIEEEVCFNCLEYVFFESFPLRKKKNSSARPGDFDEHIGRRLPVPMYTNATMADKTAIDM